MPRRDPRDPYDRDELWPRDMRERRWDRAVWGFLITIALMVAGLFAAFWITGSSVP